MRKLKSRRLTLLTVTVVLLPQLASSDPPVSEVPINSPHVGLRFQAKPLEGWNAKMEAMKATISPPVAEDPGYILTSETGKFAIPSTIEPDVIRKYNELRNLPPIESFFFGVPETVCFPDERVQVHNTELEPWNINCGLIITIQDGVMATGTGWLMGPQLVVTAGHCVHEGAAGGFFKSVEVIPGMNGPVRPFGSQVSTKLRASSGWTEIGAVSLDYGAIILDEPFKGPSGEMPGTFGIDVRTDSELVGLSIMLSGYPGDKAFGSQWRDDDPLSAVQPERLKYMLDTYGGQSGSAVVPVGESVAIGIHNYGGCPNHCTRITSGVKADLDQWLAESVDVP